MLLPLLLSSRSSGLRRHPLARCALLPGELSEETLDALVAERFVRVEDFITTEHVHGLLQDIHGLRETAASTSAMPTAGNLQWFTFGPGSVGAEMIQPVAGGNPAARAHLCELVSNLQRSLEELKAEIEEVVDKPVAAARDSHGMPKDSGGMDTGPGGNSSSLSDADIEAESLQADPPSAERKQRAKVLRRLSELDNKAHLYKDVIDKQKSLLDHQLQFLNTFAENNGCQHRDPDVILLDQRVRLMEMIKSFETDYEAIEELLSGAKPSGKSSSPSRSIRLQ